jgi:hydroxypyruvate isomerase
MLFNEVGFLDIYEKAAQSGFRAVEYLFPYGDNPAALRARLVSHGLEQVLHNLPAGDWGAGERGIAILPDRIDEFDAGVDRAIEYATALGCSQVNCLAGIKPDGLDVADAHHTMMRNLRYAAAKLDAVGIRLLIEPINTRDVPGFFLSSTEQAIEIIGRVGADNLFLQFDIYHMHVMGENVARAIERHMPRIAHMQLADAPGRHEPGTGEIDYPALFALIDRAGYTGWIGCEYVPCASTAEGLKWRLALASPSA